METLIYSLGIMTLCVSTISSITLFNIGSNVIMTNNNKNFLVNIGYIFGLFYMSIVCGMLFTINIPWIILYTIANSPDMNSTINVFCAPILKNLSNSIEDYSYKLDHQISSILEEKCGEEISNKENDEETSDEELDENDCKENDEETSDEELDENKETDKKCIEEEKGIEEEKCIEKEECIEGEEGIKKEKVSEIKCNLPTSPKNCYKCDRKPCTFGSYFEIENCAGSSSCLCVNDEEQWKYN